MVAAQRQRRFLTVCLPGRTTFRQSTASQCASGESLRVPEARKSMIPPKIAGNATPPDWFPEEHGPAPRIVTGEGGAPKWRAVRAI